MRPEELTFPTFFFSHSLDGLSSLGDHPLLFPLFPDGRAWKSRITPLTPYSLPSPHLCPRPRSPFRFDTPFLFHRTWLLGSPDRPIFFVSQLIMDFRPLVLPFPRFHSACFSLGLHALKIFGFAILPLVFFDPVRTSFFPTDSVALFQSDALFYFFFGLLR